LGLPIGNLTSQWFANAYLDGFDHHVRESLRPGGYLRYMDDIVLFDDSRDRLAAMVAEAIVWLRGRRGLEVKAERLLLDACVNGLPFLGWRVFPGVLRLQAFRLARSRRRLRGRERACRRGEMSLEQLAGSVRAMIAGIRALRPDFRFNRWGWAAEALGDMMGNRDQT